MSLLEELRAALGDAAVLEGAAMGARPASDMSLTGTSLPRALEDGSVAKGCAKLFE
ncbi:MAG: hypothetical protein RJA94_1849 [Pseudomonadota bacterium]